VQRLGVLIGAAAVVVACTACGGSSKPAASSSGASGSTTSIAGIHVPPAPTDTAATTITPPPTTQAAGSSAGPTACVGLKDPLPQGSPAWSLPAGPAPTSLQTKDLKVGSGPVVQSNATVTANYVGVACSTGKIFDSSYVHGGPQTFPLSGVIPGWTNGIPGMKVGGVRVLAIPADQAYGAQGSPPDIAPNEPLYFLVQITGVS
jgi:peptidylprolyl isomerase